MANVHPPGNWRLKCRHRQRLGEHNCRPTVDMFCIDNEHNQCRSKALRGPGSTVTWGPPFPSPPLPPTSPSPASFPPLPQTSHSPCRKSSKGVWGSAVSSLSGVWGGAPAEIEFDAF